MTTFKPGDRVKCVEPGTGGGYLEKDGVYTVEKVCQYPHIELVGIPYMWRTNRFVLVTTEPKWELDPSVWANGWGHGGPADLDCRPTSVTSRIKAWACFLDWYCHINLATVKYGKQRDRLDELAELAEAAYLARCGGSKGGVWWDELALAAKNVWIRTAQAVVDELGVDL